MDHGCVLLYLTMDAKSDSQEKDEVLYKFPPDEESTLEDMRGLFITISHLLLEVTSNTATESALLVDGEWVHVGYSRENREVLVIAVPTNKLLLSRLPHMMQDIVRLLKLLYGSLHGAFTYSGNRSDLDHIFSQLFEHIATCGISEDLEDPGTIVADPLVSVEDLLGHSLSATRLLFLPEQTKVTVNNCLSQLESADFADMSEDYYDMRRLYNILGTCLFYQGQLVASHLETEDLIDIALYTRHTGACYNENLVVWTEVFPTSRCHQQMEPLVPGYIPPTDARWFYVLVSSKRCMLGMLLESTGCMSYSDGSADCFYIDHAKATLLQLESVGLSQACHNSMHCCLPLGDAALSRVRCAMESGPWVTSTPRKSPKPARDVPPSPRQLVAGDDDIVSVATNGSDMSSHQCYVSHVNSLDDSCDTADNSHLFKGCQGRRNLLPLDEAMRLEMPLCDSRCHAGEDVRLAAHSGGSLLYYTDLQNGQGVFVCPSHPATPSSTPGLGRQFHHACLSIHELFHQAHKLRDFKENGHRSKFGVDDVFTDAVEYGIMLESAENDCGEMKRSMKLTYWVVGRYLPDPESRELYICFPESTQPNVIELAFTLAFGVTL